MQKALSCKHRNKFRIENILFNVLSFEMRILESFVNMFQNISKLSVIHNTKKSETI